MRYGLAGLVNTAIGLVIYVLCVSLLNVPFWAANFAAIIGGLICGFYLAQKFVFISNGQGFRRSSLRYTCIIALQFAMTTGLIGFLLSKGQSEVMAYVIVLPVAIALSFTLQKLWVFKPSYNEAKT